MAGTLWIDVEDLFEYARTEPRPSGIQRLAFEIYQTLQTLHGSSGLVRFIRHDPARNGFRDVEWREIVASFRGLVEVAAPSNVTLQSGIAPHPPARRLVRKWVHRLPVQIRVAVLDALVAQGHAFRAWAHLLRVMLAGMSRLPRRLGREVRRDKTTTATPGKADRANGSSGLCFATSAAPGDVLLVLGSPWSHPDYGSLIRIHRERLGVRFALLIYDLIPLRHPEWCERGLVRLFRSWFDEVFPQCDHLFAISRATAADVEAYAGEHGIVLPGPVVCIPIGTSFGAGSTGTVVKRTDRLPVPGSYALVVSTIEARKNHLLLFRIWRRMLDELPRETVPTLVFAGRVGWLVDDLMRQIANTNNLDGKLLIIETPADEELIGLYRGCLFTLLPSFYEGWGLPVTESLAMGKPCFVANRTSLPEAGGKLVRSFDPDNLHDAYTVIRNVVEDRAALSDWEAEVRSEFRPIPWSATVQALLSGLGHPLAGIPNAIIRPQGGTRLEVREA